jgi:hypothetical protein
LATPEAQQLAVKGGTKERVTKSRSPRVRRQTDIDTDNLPADFDAAKLQAFLTAWAPCKDPTGPCPVTSASIIRMFQFIMTDQMATLLSLNAAEVNSLIEKACVGFQSFFVPID